MMISFSHVFLPPPAPSRNSVGFVMLDASAYGGNDEDEMVR